jgi:hypothetical protein
MIPFFICTTVRRMPPVSKQLAAPWIRLTAPAAIAASCWAWASGIRFDAVSINPSTETTTACATLGTRSVKLVTSHPNWLTCWAAVMGGSPAGARRGCCHVSSGRA